MTDAIIPGRARPESPKDRLIFALDVDHIDEAERLVEQLVPHVGMFKVGSRLFTAAGGMIIDLINGMGSSVFLDLKFHDIPDQVAGAAREAARQRARMFTVHALGGQRMMRAAQKELMRMTFIPGMPPPLTLAVTMLTSHAPEELQSIGINDDMTKQVRRLAKLAVDAGIPGLVASGHELTALKEVVPEETIFVTPGIRYGDGSADDQSRVMTARRAVELGATYVVVGRPIRQADEPVEAAKRIVDDIAQAKA